MDETQEVGVKTVAPAPINQTDPIYVEKYGWLHSGSKQDEKTTSVSFDIDDINKDAFVQDPSVNDVSRFRVYETKAQIRMIASELKDDTLPSKYHKLYDKINRYCTIYDSWADATEADVKQDGALSIWTVLKKGFRMGAIRKNLATETSMLKEAMKELSSLLAKEQDQRLRKIMKDTLDKLRESSGGLADDTRTGHELNNDVMTKKGWEQGRTIDATGRKLKLTYDDTSFFTRLFVGNSFESNKKDEPLFSHEPCKEDIQQGGMGDCFFLAALAEVVSKDPELIKKSMLDNNDGTVTVRMYEKNENKELKPVYVTVSKRVRYSGAVGALWVSVYEKALSVLRQDKAKGKLKLQMRDETVQVSDNSIEYGYIANGGYSDNALEEAFGKKKESKIQILSPDATDTMNFETAVNQSLRLTSSITMALDKIDDIVEIKKNKAKRKLAADKEYNDLCEKINKLTNKYATVDQYSLSGKEKEDFDKLVEENNEEIKKLNVRVKEIEDKAYAQYNKLEAQRKDLIKASHQNMADYTRKIDDTEKRRETRLLKLRDKDISEKVKKVFDTEHKEDEKGYADNLEQFQRIIAGSFWAYFKFKQKETNLKTGTKEELKKMLQTLSSNLESEDEALWELGYIGWQNSLSYNSFLAEYLEDNEEIREFLESNKLLTDEKNDLLETISKLCLDSIKMHLKVALQGVDRLYVREKRMLSGEYSQYVSDLFETIKEGIASGKHINLGTKTLQSDDKNVTGEGLVNGIAGHHAYSVLDTMEKNGRKFVKLRNPWGQYTMKYVEVQETQKVRKIVNGQSVESTEQVKVIKNEVSEKAKDGVFWIEMNNLTQFFNEIYINAA